MKASRLAATASSTNRRPGASFGKAERVGKSSDDIFLDKSLTTKVMAERRRKYLCLDQEVKDILAGNLGFCPSAPEHLKGWSKWKYLIWELVELSDKPSTVSLVVTAWILGLVAVSSVCAIVETLPTLRLEYIDLWKGLEYFFMFNFSIEFFLRIVSCPDKGVFLGVMLNWIDAVVVIPFWIEETIALTSGGGGMPNLTFVRLLRLGKGIRLVKLGRFSRGVRMLKESLVNSIDALQLFLVLLLMSVLVCASLMYYAERGKFNEAEGFYYRTYNRGLDPDGMHELEDSSCWFAEYNSSVTNKTKYDCARVKSPFQSVPHSMWFAIITLMTVGYGDVVPLTYNGQFCGIITVLIGILTLVLPLSIIQSSFIDERRRMKVEEGCEKAHQVIREIVQLDSGINALAAEDLEKMTPQSRKLKLKMEKVDQAADDQNLLPTMMVLAEELRKTATSLPITRDDAAQCVALLYKMRSHPVRMRAQNSIAGELGIVETAPETAPETDPDTPVVTFCSPRAANYKVHPEVAWASVTDTSPGRNDNDGRTGRDTGPGRNDNDVSVRHDDANLPNLNVDSWLTGKEYLVPEEELKEFFTRVRRMLLGAEDCQKSWRDAQVDETEDFNIESLSPKSSETAKRAHHMRSISDLGLPPAFGATATESYSSNTVTNYSRKDENVGLSSQKSTLVEDISTAETDTSR